MARFDRLDTSKLELLDKKKCFLVKGTLTLDDVNKLNEVNKKIVLIFENTKGQNSDVIGYLNPEKIRISVVGGLDYLHKSKYNNADCIRRTIHTPKNIANIIKIFEAIERKVMYSWSDSQKCMYVYKNLCEMMNSFDTMDKPIQNGEDFSNSLSGLLYRRITCEGISLAFKEMMDRLSVECYFQSVGEDHSFNVVKFDGEYHGMDIYWDIRNKKYNNKCGFNYYCREDGNAFYSNKYHDISNEKEEIRFPVVPIKEEILQSILTSVELNKKEISPEMTKYTNSSGETFEYTYLGESNGFSAFVVRQDDFINYFYISKNEEFVDKLTNENLSKACYNGHNLSDRPLPEDIKKFSRYIRKDGSNFTLCPTGKELFDGIKEYTMLEPKEIDGKKVLRKSIILSNSDLVNVKANDVRNVIANYLLSSDRLEDRLKNYGGYVGFVTSESAKYLTPVDESEEYTLRKGA